MDEGTEADTLHHAIDGHQAADRPLMVDSPHARPGGVEWGAMAG
ncbi:hypothetical protein ACPEIC_39365 [Stenotrophomonas sp. NPDC087984]